MKVTVIPVVNGALGTVPKGSVGRLEEDELRPIQTTEKVGLARILWRILETLGRHGVTQSTVKDHQLILV